MEKKTIFSAVVAMDPNRLIGKDGGIPWHISEDLKLFRRLTTGHPILMGRKTYDSLNKPLPDRQNIVLTRHAEWEAAEGVFKITSPNDLESIDLMDDEVCIIGGSQIYQLMMNQIDLLWISKVRATYDGDTWFPEFEDAFPYSKKVEEFEDFDLYLYVRDKQMLDSSYANRLKG